MSSDFFDDLAARSGLRPEAAEPMRQFANFATRYRRDSNVTQISNLDLERTAEKLEEAHETLQAVPPEFRGLFLENLGVNFVVDYKKSGEMVLTFGDAMPGMADRIASFNICMMFMAALAQACRKMQIPPAKPEPAGRPKRPDSLTFAIESFANIWTSFGGSAPNRSELRGSFIAAAMDLLGGAEVGFDPKQVRAAATDYVRSQSPPANMAPGNSES